MLINLVLQCSADATRKNLKLAIQMRSRSRGTVLAQGCNEAFRPRKIGSDRAGTERLKRMSVREANIAFVEIQYSRTNPEGTYGKAN